MPISSRRCDSPTKKSVTFSASTLAPDGGCVHYAEIDEGGGDAAPPSAAGTAPNVGAVHYATVDRSRNTLFPPTLAAVDSPIHYATIDRSQSTSGYKLAQSENFGQTSNSADDDVTLVENVLYSQVEVTSSDDGSTPNDKTINNTPGYEPAVDIRADPAFDDVILIDNVLYA